MIRIVVSEMCWVTATGMGWASRRIQRYPQMETLTAFSVDETFPCLEMQTRRVGFMYYPSVTITYNQSFKSGFISSRLRLILIRIMET